MHEDLDKDTHEEKDLKFIQYVRFTVGLIV